MRTILRFQSQLLLRRSYKPRRGLRLRPQPRPALVFRPLHRFGEKPRLETVP